jgi:serine/threonine protein kinase|tara:strand:- start:1344 stop:2609 length:1266 start_codon:yes stop_codon:yes gene_type:complete
MFFDVSEYLFHNTKRLSYPVERIDHISSGITQYTRNVIYLGPASGASGTWAQVDLNVAFNGVRGVIKHITEERPINEIVLNAQQQEILNIPKEVEEERKKLYGKVVFFTSAIYELVMQLYLSIQTARYKGLTIPRLFWVRKTRNNTLDAFMQKSPGVFLLDVRTNILVALAHIMKHLYRLQIEEQFMHRDFHAGNVSFDEDTLEVGIIDFGMACVNPKRARVAWQANNPDFFRLFPGTMAAACTNRSIDVCCLVASIEYKAQSPFLSAEYERMLKQFKTLLKNAPANIKNPFKDKDSGLFTHISGKNWRIGNVIGKPSVQHFWTYNMVEIPCADWYPERFLARLLKQLPFKDWFPIRKNFSKFFDPIVPTDIRVKNKRTGVLGTLVKLHKNNSLNVKLDSGELKTIPVDDTVIITDPAITF